MDLGAVTRALTAALLASLGAVRAETQTATWTSLVPLAELTAHPVSAELELPSLLTRPPPRVGLFWTAGLPAGLARDVAARRAAFSAQSRAASGAYRRPFEASTRNDRGLHGEAWGLLGSRGGAYGRIGLSMIDFGNEAFGNTVRPYVAEPYVVADTVGEPLFAMNVEIEGAGAWRLGRLLVGLGLGLAQRETRTVESPVPVLNRWSEPGLVVSAAWDFGTALQVGAIGRWQIETEFMNVLSLRAPTRLYRFTGYEEPVPINLSANLWARRFERAAQAGGGAAGGELFGIGWTVFLQRETRSSENFDLTGGRAGTIDRWDARGWRAGGAVQGRIGGLVLTTNAGHVALSGEAALAAIPDEVVFEANDARTAVTLEARLLPWRGWEAAASIGLARERRYRYDDLVGVASDIRAWRPSGALEIARTFGAFSTSVAVARAEHNPTGSLPRHEAMDPIYQNWLAPAVSFDAASAAARILGATLRWQPRPTTALWLGAWHSRAAPAGRVGVRSARPIGARAKTSVVLGIILQ